MENGTVLCEIPSEKTKPLQFCISIALTVIILLSPKKNECGLLKDRAHPL